MILGPVLALVACFLAIGILGAAMALHDYLKDHA